MHRVYMHRIQRQPRDIYSYFQCLPCLLCQHLLSCYHIIQLSYHAQTFSKIFIFRHHPNEMSKLSSYNPWPGIHPNTFYQYIILSSYFAMPSICLLPSSNPSHDHVIFLILLLSKGKFQNMKPNAGLLFTWYFSSSVLWATSQVQILGETQILSKMWTWDRPEAEFRLKYTLWANLRLKIKENVHCRLPLKLINQVKILVIFHLKDLQLAYCFRRL